MILHTEDGVGPLPGEEAGGSTEASAKVAMPPPYKTVVVKARGLADSTPVSQRKKYHGTSDARYYCQVDTGVYVRKTPKEEWEDQERPTRRSFSRTRRGSTSKESCREGGMDYQERK